jgi:putative membrane protein
MKMHKHGLMAAVSGLALLLGTTAVTAADNSSDQRGQLSAKDYKFIKEAAEGGMAEVQMGEIVKQKANSQTVRSFADRMVTDHTKANNELKELAAKKGATLPADLSHHERSIENRLEKTSGPEFDKKYAADMVKDHKKDLKEFRAAANNSTDPDVKAWAEKTVATLEEHLRLAEQMEAEVGNAK